LGVANELLLQQLPLLPLRKRQLLLRCCQLAASQLLLGHLPLPLLSLLLRLLWHLLI
jgi:hypothetical protein